MRRRWKEFRRLQGDLLQTLVLNDDHLQRRAQLGPTHSMHKQNRYDAYRRVVAFDPSRSLLPDGVVATGDLPPCPLTPPLLPRWAGLQERKPSPARTTPARRT